MCQFLSLSGRQYVCQNEDQFELLRREFALLHAVVHEELVVNDAKRMVTNVLSRIILLASSFFSSAEPSEVLPAEIDYINRYFRHPITLEEVANVVGLSSYYFSRKFHHEHGITFQEYLIKKRLAWAHNLILNSTQSVSRIAEESGFHSRNHFIKKFKQYYNYSPSDLRNKKKPNS
jgi:AraC-like DNA-binding protein